MTATTQIHVYPLSFTEYYQGVGGDKMEAWRDYCTYGGLPLILHLDTDQKKAQYLKNLYQTVYKQDLEERNKIFKSDEFDSLVKVMASIIGSPCNPSKLANTFLSDARVKVYTGTIATYLGYLEDAFLIENAQRYDVKGKKYIGSLSKYYFRDLGLRNALLDFRQQEETHIMENIIYNELRTRGFSVDIGSVEVRQQNENKQSVRKQLEVDFVAGMGSKRYYIQSALSMADEQKRVQKSASLLNIKDNFKKIIVVKDFIKPWYTQDGILILGLFDFLLDPSVLDF